MTGGTISVCVTETVETADHLLYQEAQKVYVCLRQWELLYIYCSRRNSESVYDCVYDWDSGNAVYIQRQEAHKVCV